MPRYRIERLGLESEWSDQIARVVGDAFDLRGTSHDVIRHIAITTNSHLGRSSIFFGAIENHELIGFNAFIAHEIEIQGAPLFAYQSEWSATKPEHRGRRVFQNIQREAHQELARQGASMVIGWPNKLSEPLLVDKLRYRRESSVKRNIPGLWPEKFFRRRAANPVGISQNDAQLIKIKRAIYGDRIFIEGQGADLLWGVLKFRATNFGSFPYFKVGGIRWSQPGGARELAERMRKRLPRVAYWQIISEARNSINPSIGNFVPAAVAPLVWFALDREIPPGPFDFFSGMRGFY